MNLKELRKIISSDYQRYIPVGGGVLQRLILMPAFKLVFWFRIGTWLKSKNGLLKILYILVGLYYRHLATIYCIDLRLGTPIGGGLCFAHIGSIVINPSVKIGNNCLIFQGVTLGAMLRPGKMEVPVIGDNVTIFAGAKIIGGVHIGNNAIIGANAVVTKDVNENEVVAGIPAKVVSRKGLQYTELYKSCL